MPRFKGEKLRVNLRLCINRLKLLEKKKTEQALKARKEIADYIKGGRIERARIRVEHIIREDYLVEAMEVIELYCDLLLARFGMLESMSHCEDSLIESVSTLIWIAPRLSAEVQELHVVADQLALKFSKAFADQARSNLSGTVNPKVIHRLGIEAPKKSLVENYLIEIARNYHVPYEPDPTALMDEDMLPPPGDEKPYFGDGDGGNGGETSSAQANPYAPTPYNPAVVPPPTQATAPSPAASNPLPQAGPLPTKVPPGPHDFHSVPAPPYSEQPPASHTALPYPTGSQQGQQPPALPPGHGAGGLDLPPVPTTGFPSESRSAGSDSGGGGGDVDFDDLTRRFEELKRRR